MLDGANQHEMITDDFVAAFLQAGISVNKLDHPAIRGLIQKYTQVKCFTQYYLHLGSLGFWCSESWGLLVQGCRESE
jgi:hypothetical protein